MVNDLKEIILLQKPDIIFGSDYDYHEEHHLVTIAIDEALGKVLKSKSKYRPMVMKSYAYRTTWESYPDYYKIISVLHFTRKLRWKPIRGKNGCVCP